MASLLSGGWPCLMFRYIPLPTALYVCDGYTLKGKK